MLKALAYTVLTIMGLYLGYVFAATPGLEPQVAWTLLIIYCGALVLDLIEFKKIMQGRR